MLSSETLFEAAVIAGCEFCLTECILYECLWKPRQSVRPQDAALRQRLLDERGRGRFRAYRVDLEDIQEPSILAVRNRLGKGELSGMAFAVRTRQAFMTDDQKARRLAERMLPPPLVQTTPHLLGWLFYTSHLGDGDKAVIVTQHESLCRHPLTRYFEEVYRWALKCRLSSETGGQSSET